MNKHQFTGIVIAALLISPLHAQQQQDPEDNLLVYGVRLDQAQAEVGSSISVITADDIDALGVDYVLDAIATAPAVTINQNGSQGGAESVRIRGAASAQTLVIVDGVVVNDPSAPAGGFDFARLDPAHVERIENLLDRDYQQVIGYGTPGLSGYLGARLSF